MFHSKIQIDFLIFLQKGAKRKVYMH